MKRNITYVTKDGTTFSTRLDARRHETELVRVARVEQFLSTTLPTLEKVTISAVAAAILKDTNAFLAKLSARAARRSLLNEKINCREGPPH